jgi:hypothetical protein
MSLIKTNAVQIGQSNTATDNFTLAVPSSPDGTIKLARGNSGATTQDVLNVSNTGVVSFPQGFATSSITANVTGNLTGDVTGDVFASNGTSKVLENGTNGTDATFTGSVLGGTLSGNASSATALATGSSTARSLANRFADVVNVLDFGADPSASAETNTIAIQAALDYAAQIVQTIITNKVDIVKAKVIIPSGIYQTNATLLVGEGVTLEGASQSTSIIKPTHTGVAIQMGGSSREYSQVIIRNIGIIGNKSGTISYGLWTTTTTIGIYVQNCIRECSIQNCFITWCATSIKTENSYAFEINQNYLSTAIDYHIEADNLVGGRISGNRIDWSEKHGIYINGTNSVDETISLVIESNAIQICWKNGLWLYDVSSVTVQNNFFESNYREAVDGTTHVYADINIETGTNNRGYSFNIIGNFFTHGSSPDVDAYTAIRCNRAVCLNTTGNVCRDSYYWRFIDANNVNVQRIIALGNSYEGSFTKIAFDSSTTFGIIEEQLSDGTISIPKLSIGTLTYGTTITSSNGTTSEFKTAFLINCTSGNRQLNLRDIDCVPGRMYIVKKTDSGANVLSVTRESGSTKTIDGATSITDNSAYAKITVISDGTNWFTI